MATVKRFHTNSTEYHEKDRQVYHDKDTCPDGKRIQEKHREPGDGGKRHCKECEKVV